MKEIKQIYENIVKECEKLEGDTPSFSPMHDDIKDIKNTALNHLTLFEWQEKYGLDIEHRYNPYTNHYFRLSPDCMIFSKFGDAEQDKNNGSGKYISWSDDGKQPKNEWLFELSFPTGAYFFGDDYNGQQNLFQDFFNELKSYNPDYSDTNNKTLYWKLENAKDIYTSLER